MTRPVLRHDKEYREYSEHIAQDNICAGAQNKGRGMRFTNVLAQLLAIKIKTERKSPAHARKELLAEGIPYVPAVSTIYAHINRGDIGILHGETLTTPSGGPSDAPLRRAFPSPNASLSKTDPMSPPRRIRPLGDGHHSFRHCTARAGYSCSLNARPASIR